MKTNTTTTTTISVVDPATRQAIQNALASSGRAIHEAGNNNKPTSTSIISSIPTIGWYVIGGVPCVAIVATVFYLFASLIVGGVVVLGVVYMICRVVIHSMRDDASHTTSSSDRPRHYSSYHSWYE